MKSTIEKKDRVSNNTLDFENNDEVTIFMLNFKVIYFFLIYIY